MKEPIRVAQIMGKLWAGGVESVVFNYYRAIDKTKVQFDFYYDSDSTVEIPQELIDMGARFYEIPPYQKLPSYLKTLRKYFRENKYKIVHSHINTLSVFPLFVAWLERIPVRIAHNHSVPGGNEFKRNLLKYLLRCFSKFFPTDYFACSEKAGRWMFGDTTFNRGQVTVVRNAIDFKKFQLTQGEIQDSKYKYDLKDKFVVGHVGRFTYAKNHNKLLEIFSEICSLKENAILILVGDGELREQIVAKTRELRLEDKVLFVGQRSDPEKYYQLIDVMIIPSFFEGLSLTTIESQIAGVPVVISENIPDEAIISNACEHMYLEKSSRAWAEKAILITEKEVILQKEADNYDINRAVIKLENWYKDHF